LIGDYIPVLGIVGNAMRGMIFGVIPYRYLLICTLFLIGYGRYIAPAK